MLARPLSINKKKPDAEITPIQPAFPEVNTQVTCTFPVHSTNFRLQYVSFRTTMRTINVHTIGQKMFLKPSANERLHSNKMTDPEFQEKFCPGVSL